MPQVLLALGSNLGNVRENVEQTIDQLAKLHGIDVQAASSLQATQPVGGPVGQGRFANAVVAIETDESPTDLLMTFKGLEQALGRVKAERWAARPLDLDLLLYGEQVVRFPTLTVPHPRMSFRPFVLNPAVEIASDWRHPLLCATLGELHHRLHHGDDALVIYGGSEPDRCWHAERLCDRFTGVAIVHATDLETLLATSSRARTDQPRLAIQLQTAGEHPRPSMPTLSIPAGGREDVVFDTEAAVCAVWPDLCRWRVGE